jgi:hypothetical protein
MSAIGLIPVDMTAHADVWIHSLLYEFFYSEDSMYTCATTFKDWHINQRIIIKMEYNVCISISNDMWPR